MGELATMGQMGDTKLIWDPDNAAEVDNAKRTFDDLKRKGFRAFSVTGDKGKKGVQIDAFDKTAGRIIMIPAMAGG